MRWRRSGEWRIVFVASVSFRSYQGWSRLWSDTEIHLEERTRALLLQISPATADRLLRPARRKEGRRHGLSATKPGTLLKQSIPVRTFAEWEEAKPGFMEVDLVAHGGDSARGEYLHSLDMVDVATRWTECLAIVNRSQTAVSAANRHRAPTLALSPARTRLRQWQ